MIRWKRLDNISIFLDTKAFNNYSNSDLYVYKNIINNVYRICINQNYNDFLFECYNIQSVNDFFKNLFNE